MTDTHRDNDLTQPSPLKAVPTIATGGTDTPRPGTCACECAVTDPFCVHSPEGCYDSRVFRASGIPLFPPSEPGQAVEFVEESTGRTVKMRRTPERYGYFQVNAPIETGWWDASLVSDARVLAAGAIIQIERGNQ